MAKEIIVREPTYKLSDMWKVWILYKGEIFMEIYTSLNKAKFRASETAYKPLAITKGDATEFKEGEGL